MSSSYRGTLRDAQTVIVDGLESARRSRRRERKLRARSSGRKLKFHLERCTRPYPWNMRNFCLSRKGFSAWPRKKASGIQAMPELLRWRRSCSFVEIIRRCGQMSSRAAREEFVCLRIVKVDVAKFA